MLHALDVSAESYSASELFASVLLGILIKVLTLKTAARSQHYKFLL